jgi:hypothetical protein
MNKEILNLSAWFFLLCSIIWAIDEEMVADNVKIGIKKADTEAIKKGGYPQRAKKHMPLQGSTAYIAGFLNADLSKFSEYVNDIERS